MAKKPPSNSSKPYRGGHTGKGGSHEKGGCLAAIVALAVIVGGVAEAVQQIVS